MYTHRGRKRRRQKKPAQKSSLFFFFFFPHLPLSPHPLYSDDPKKSPFFLSFFRTCKPEQLAFHIKYAPFNDALFSKTRKLHIPRFPPSEKREGNETEYISPPDSHAHPLPLSLFPRMWKEGKRRRERIHPQKWGGKGNEQMHFYSRFWTQAEFISRVAFSFPLVRELRVRTRKKRVNLFRGGALLNFDIKPSKRIREGFWKWKGIGVNFFGGVKGWRRRFFDAATCCFLPHFFYRKKLWKKSASRIFCATCMRIWCALGNWNSILRSGSCTRVFRSPFLRENCIIFIFIPSSFLFGEPSALKYPVFSRKTLREERKTERLCPFLSSLSHPPI